MFITKLNSKQKATENGTRIQHRQSDTQKLVRRGHLLAVASSQQKQLTRWARLLA